MEAAVIGIPSAEWGEDIVAVVVLRPGERATAERATAEQLRVAALASGLTRFKCPVRDRLRAGAAAQRDRQDPDSYSGRAT